MGVTASPSKTALIGAIRTARKALAKISNLPARAQIGSGIPADFKLFEMALVRHFLPPATSKWQCSSAPHLTLHMHPMELARATVFSNPAVNCSLGLNVNVHYAGSPNWRGARHEADIALFLASQSGMPMLDYFTVARVVEAKYRWSVPKSVLRELAFISSQFSPSSFQRVILAIPRGNWRTASLPSYWADAYQHYRVGVRDVPFP